MEPSDAEQTAIEEGLAMLREGRFFDAHERFEEVFRNARGDTRTLFHALAQLAAAYHQLAQGRARAFVRTWEKARCKFESLGALSHTFAHEVETFRAKIGAGADTPRFLPVEELPPREHWPCPRDLLPFVSATRPSTL